MITEKMIDVYECYWYQHYGEKYSHWCKYYPNFCNKCLDLTKVGTIKESELKK